MKDIKTKLKHKMMNKRPREEKEANYNTSDFIWVGGFKSKKRKISVEEELFSSDISTMLRRWSKNLQEDMVESPAKKGRHSDIWQVPRQRNITSTPILQRKNLDFQPQINAFKDHFCAGPDFKIYDDYNYPDTPKKGVDYKNLEEGNTPAPPLPPRNKDTPPPVVRNYGARLDFNMNIEKQILKQLKTSTNPTFLRTYSTNCLSISLS